MVVLSEAPVENGGRDGLNPTDVWKLLVSRGLIGPRTCQVYQIAFTRNASAISCILNMCLFAYLFVYLDPVLVEVYSPRFLRFLFGCGAAVDLFHVLMICMGRRILASKICAHVVDGVDGAWGPRRAARAKYNSVLYDRRRCCDFTTDARVWMLLVYSLWRTCVSFLWRLPGVAVWVLYVNTFYIDLVIVPASHFVMDLLLTLSHDLVWRVLRLMQDRSASKYTSDGSLAVSIWSKVAAKHCELNSLLTALWAAATPYFWVRLVLSFMMVFVPAIGCLLLEFKGAVGTDLVASCSALVALINSIFVLHRLWAYADVTAQCSSYRACGTSIPVEATKHCFAHPMTKAEEAEYQSFLLYLSTTRVGIKVGPTIDKEFFGKLAVPAITFASSLFTFTLSKLDIHKR